MKKKLMLGLPLAALALAGVAYAADTKAPRGDANGDGVVTRAEVQAHAAEMFAMFDANKDGKIDMADREVHKAGMFDKFDANKDGAISRDEFAKTHPQGPDGERGPGQGRMMHGEMKHGEGAGGHHMAMMMLHKADSNHDQAITRDELTAGVLQHFDAADSNKDGKLTSEERKAAHEKMRGMMGGHRGRHG